MKFNFLLGLRVVIALAALLSGYDGLGQLVQGPKIESPNAAGIDMFTNVPVDLFTGTPNVTIPIHTLKYGRISVPIALRYHPGLVRPALQPGWVGMGWDLESFGAITRYVRGSADDLYGDPGTANQPQSFPDPYYPMPGNPTAAYGSGSELANGSDWDTKTRLVNNYTVNGIYNGGDLLADEFSFNFLGYSGKFYYSGPTLGWQVVSIDNIKVVLNGFLKPVDIDAGINEFKPFQQTPVCGQCGPATGDYQPNDFAGFTLTVPDGTQYIFGGKEAIEYTSEYTFINEQVQHPFQFPASAWLLNEIIDPVGNTVNFTYQRTYPTCNLGFGQSYQTYTACNSLQSTSPSGIITTTKSGEYQWPMYLSKISSPNETINFTIGDATCLRYPDVVLQSQSEGGIGTTDDVNPLPLNNQLSNLRWEQLNGISIADSSSNTYRQYSFSYSNSTTQRLTLNNFTEQDNTGFVTEAYSFLYNNPSVLPMYDGNYTDHWGFYNGVDESGINSAVIGASKSTNTTLVTTGLLTQITFPTGGTTKLNWEAHDYSQVVNAQRNGLNTAAPNSYAGGSRIKEIASYDKTGIQLLDKKYYYVRGYNNGATLSSLSSSGILNGVPSYNYTLSNRATPDGTGTANLVRGSINSLGAYGYNGAGSYIGYDEVAEVNPAGSYTRHFFTSYGPDLNGLSHYDILPTGYLGWDPTQDVYFPMSTLDQERGKSIGDYHYTAANILVRKTTNTYRSDAARFNNFIKLIDFGGAYAVCNQTKSVIFTSARKQFTYDYYPVSTTTTDYDQQGLNPLVSTDTYIYNANNLVTTKTRINSKGETAINYFKYPTDYTDATSTAMVAAHILNPVIEASSAIGVNTQTLTHTNYFTPSNLPGVFLPQTIQMQFRGNPIETRQQFYQYGAHGNPVEMSKTNDIHEVYLWGYRGEYVVAKITGSTYGAVSTIVNQAQIDAATSSDASMRTLMQTLRAGLPHALVSSYTYLPLTGMTSETDPQGRTTYYEYDPFQRLKLVRDYNNNIIKTYSYQYEN